MGRETQRRRQSRNLTWDLWMHLGCCAPPQNHGQNVVCPATLRGGNGAASPPWLVSGFDPEVPKLRACSLQPAASRGRSAQGCEKQSPDLAAARGWASGGPQGSGFSTSRCPPATEASQSVALGVGAAGGHNYGCGPLVSWVPGWGQPCTSQRGGGLLGTPGGAFKNTPAQAPPLETVLSGSGVGPDISIC